MSGVSGWFNDHDARPWWVLLFVLLAALVLVGQVNAWYFVDRDGVYGNQLAGGTIVQKLDAQHIMYTYSGFNTIYYDTSYPTTEWSAYIATMSTHGGLNYYPMDSGKSIIVSPVGIETSKDVYYLFKIIRRYTGGIYYYDRYVNGAFQNSKSAVGTTPYYCAFGLPYASSSPTKLYFLTGGEDEEENLVITHPSTYFIAKDFTNPAFSGLYSALDSSVWADRFYARYISNTSAKNITIKNKATGVTVYSHATTGVCGLYQFNITEIFFNSGVPYGVYTVALDGSTQSQDIPYMGIVTSGTSVAWNATEYGEDDTAIMTFSIAEGYWDTDSYTYRLEVWDESLNEVEGWAVTSRPVAATKTTTIDSDYAEGTYYCVLTATDISSSEEILMTYDTCTVDIPGSGDVWVVGTTYDATTNLTLVSCTVTGTQMGVDQSTTSDAGTGAYEIKNFVTDWSVGMNASKTGYIGYLMAFTPYDAGTYTVDIPLVPSGGPAPGSSSNTTTAYYNSTVDGTAIGGICWEGPYWTLCEGCNVTVSNSTWSCTTQTGAGGWYQCNNIGCGGTYTLTCSKEGYTNYTKSCTLEEDCFNREDCTLESSTDLNVNCKELSTGALITGTTITVSLSTGEECTTTNGTAVFSGLAYGYYEIEAAAEGYYPGSASAVMDEGKTVTCYLQSQSERTGGSGISYAPHPVRFSFRDQSSNPLDGMTITATPLECTGPWTWLTEWLGLNQTAVDIQGTTLSGTTGDDGSWTAWMIETVRYRMNVVDASRGINTTWTLYPKESEYAYLIDLEPTVPEFEGNIEWNVSAIEVNTTHLYLHCAYSDLLDHTDSCSISVMNSTGGVVYTQACSPANNCSVNYTVENIKGNAYTWGFTAEHTDFGTITNYKGITLEGTGGRLVDLGLDDFWYDMISLGALFMVALFFSSKMNPHGAITLALTGGILWFIGWLNISYLFVACAIVIAILIYVEKKEERSPV